MSRAALLARDLPALPLYTAPPVRRARQTRARTGSARHGLASAARGYRLLGGLHPQGEACAGAGLSAGGSAASARHPRHALFLHVAEAPEPNCEAEARAVCDGAVEWPHAGPERATPPHAQVRFKPGWPVGAWVGLPVVAVVLVALMVFMASALAMARSGGWARGWVLSGYTELPAGRPVAAQQPANETTAPQAPPPQVEQPAPDGAGPQAPVPTGQPYEVVGPPTIGVPQIEAVLQEYGSPASGLGQKLYDLGVRYGIDPAFALAFFVHESACGTRGVARFTRSLGNIRWTEGYGNYEGYRLYPSWEAGFEDWYKLITGLYVGQWNLRTVDQIVPVYAPWGDGNHPPTYIASIKSMVDQWRRQSAGRN